MRFPVVSERVLACSLTASVVIFSGSAAFAIPSPELVIGSISSLSQVFAMGFAMVGGLSAAVAARFGIKLGGSGQSSVGLSRALLVLVLIAFGLLAGNIYQYQSQADAELRRLQATLNRPAQFDGTQIQDASLVETSFSEQQTSALAVTTEEAENLFEQSKADPESILFLDIREDAENSMGTIPGTDHKRFPDIGSASELADKKVVLFCHNGNRSSETCARLAALGIDCRFIAGGIEKWIVEGRPFSDPEVRDLSDLRAIPDYPNKDVLMSTETVAPLLNAQEVQVVDTRYPGDFATGHLPGAINIPLRALPTNELKAAIDALPDLPIVAACYDRRSCFMGQVLGLELTQTGREFLGRYTVPWEYFVPKAPKPHIAAWLEEQNKTLWRRSIEAIAAGLGHVSQITGALGAILLVSVISRLAVLPISVKSEKDQIKNAELKEEIASLKQRLKSDPRRLSRALQQMNRDHGLTPLRNMLALAFLPLMMLGLASIQTFAGTQETGFWWNAAMGAPDSLFVTPVIFAVLAGIYMHVTIARTLRARLIAWGLAVPGLFALASPLSIAGTVYLVASMSLLLIQRGWIAGWFTQAAARVKHIWRALLIRTLHRGIVPLRYSDYLRTAGNKSYRLSVLQDNGVEVPDGVVLTTAFLRSYRDASPVRKKMLQDRIWQMVGAKTLAVRSSAAAEDGENMSFAGVFESALHVTRGRLGSAIAEVMASFEAEKAGAYDGLSTTDRGGNILIHRMVNAQYSGVLFTQHPTAAGLSLVEMVEGTADDLVSGRVTPEVLSFGRYSHTPVAEEGAAIDLAPLLRIGAQAEQIFNAPQDIEWTYTDGRFEIVQSRDITTLGPHEVTALDAMWHCLFAEHGAAEPTEIVLAQDEMSEVLPTPTPLSLSYMKSVWSAGGSVDLACRKLGLTYNIAEGASCHLTTVFGRLYSNLRRKSAQSVLIPNTVQKRLRRDPMAIARDFQNGVLPRFEADMQRQAAVSFKKLPLETVQQELRAMFNQYIYEVNADVEVVNIAADFYLAEARALCKAQGIAMVDHLAATVDKGPNAILRDAHNLPEQSREAWLVGQMGHRAVFDYELSAPRYSETPSVLVDLSASVLPGSGKLAEPAQATANLPAEVQEALNTAMVYMNLKEEAKHAATRLLAIIRKALLALDKKIGADGLCFYLTMDELVQDLTQRTDALLDLARQRRKDHRDMLRKPPVATQLSLIDLERASDPSLGAAVGDGIISGQRVSGKGPDSGKVFVVPHDASDPDTALEGFNKGDVIVCDIVHPAWLRQVLEAGAVLASVGGWLSHMAIVAREHDIPMIVNAKGLQSLATGDMVRIAEDGSVEVTQTSAEVKASNRAVS